MRANDALSLAGLVPDPAETPLEFSRRAGQRLDTAGEAHRALAVATTAAEYAEGGVSVQVAEGAAADAKAVVRGVKRRTTRGGRVARRLGLAPKPEDQSSRRKRSRMR
jgi:hypothetical protein